MKAREIWSLVVFHDMGTYLCHKIMIWAWLLLYFPVYDKADSDLELLIKIVEIHAVIFIWVPC